MIYMQDLSIFQVIIKFIIRYLFKIFAENSVIAYVAFITIFGNWCRMNFLKIIRKLSSAS